MRFGYGLQRIDGDIEAPIGTVLEAHGAGEAARHLPVCLRFGGACADRSPGDEVVQVLRRDRIQCLSGQGHAEITDVQEQLSRDL